MGVDLWANAHFFDDNVVLLSPSVVFLLLREVLLLPVVLDLAHRWPSIRSDLDKVEPFASRHIQSGFDFNKAVLLALVVDEPNLPYTDLLVEPNLDLCRGLSSCGAVTRNNDYV
jgi:hypothetical protein